MRESLYEDHIEKVYCEVLTQAGFLTTGGLITKGRLSNRKCLNTCGLCTGLSVQ